MPQNQVQPTIFFLKCPVPSQESGHCYIIVRFCVCYILMLCFCCVVVLLLFLMRFPVLGCNPYLFFSLGIYEFQTAVYYCCFNIELPTHNEMLTCNKLADEPYQHFTKKFSQGGNNL